MSLARRKREMGVKLQNLDLKLSETGLALLELNKQTRELLQAFNSKCDTELCSVVNALPRTLGRRKKFSSMEEIVSTIEKELQDLEMILRGTEDPGQAAWLGGDQTRRKLTLLTLASKSRFDYAHDLHAFQEKATSMMNLKEHDREQSITKIASTAYDDMKENEAGFKSNVIRIMSILKADEANELGKMYLAKNRPWHAEAAWSHAIELQDDPKFRTNRAHVRIVLARRMRSMYVAYHRPARQLLEQALADATAAFDQVQVSPFQILDAFT